MDSEDEDHVDSLAATRERRSNAGARMSKLLLAEDEDEFYKTTYGGFNEEEDDNDYSSEDSVSDDTDSDIDIDENDEIKSDLEDEGETKRTKRVVTKAYKEPKKDDKPNKSAVPKPRPPPAEKSSKVEIIDTERKSLRHSTTVKSINTQLNVKEQEQKAALLKSIADKRKVAAVRRLTQEELLAEAMVTEQINLRSLEMYQRMELEKKRSKVHRPVQKGPMIRYRSITLPLPDKLQTDNTSNTQNQSEVPIQKYSRTFISFSDDNVFQSCFPPNARKRPHTQIRAICPITGLPAKYLDPLTNTPYATLDAFKVIRARHARDDVDIERYRPRNVHNYVSVT